ncbi:MAG: META domain-containing protein [Dehalococcoidales bacterium]|nr:MAG: META domain-containing protein [Dehalococcoidales bacterium]
MSKVKYSLVVGLAVILAFGACKGESAEPEVEDAAGARDTALEYLREQYPESALGTGLQWQEEDITPGGLVGSSAKQFTSDGLTVTVSAPVVAPEYIIYTTTTTSTQNGWHWEGEVEPDGTVTELSPLTEMSEAWSRDIAEEFVKNSPTFTYDGIEETLELTDTLTARCPFCWAFTFEFDSRHAGYGTREGETLAQVITPHEAVIIINKGEVVSAIMDREWDMLRQAFVTLESTRWVLESFGNPDNPQAVLEDTVITAEFSAGEVSGSAGCNSYFGSYVIDGQDITIGSIASTEMACLEPEGVMDQETLYLLALGQAERFQIEDSTLEIFYSGGQVLIFSAE